MGGVKFGRCWNSSCLKLCRIIFSGPSWAVPRGRGCWDSPALTSSSCSGTPKCSSGWELQNYVEFRGTRGQPGVPAGHFCPVVLGDFAEKTNSKQGEIALCPCCWALQEGSFPAGAWGAVLTMVGALSGFTLHDLNLFFLTPTDTALKMPLGKVFKGLLEFLDYHRLIHSLSQNWITASYLSLLS